MSRKNIILKMIILIVIPLMGFKGDKCNLDALYEKLVSSLKNVSILKDYRIYSKKNKKLTPDDYEYFTITLNRGVTYKFQTLSDPSMDGKLIINLYNNPQKEFMFATTLSQGTTSTIRESIEFKCQRTGNFLVGYYFLDGEEGCGVAVSVFQQ